MKHAQPIEYAGLGVPRPRCGLPWWALGLAAASPVLSVALLMMADRNVLPSHFLCCRYSGVALAVLVIIPLAATVMGIAAIAKVVRLRLPRTFLIPGVGAVILGLFLCAAGIMVFAALKA